VTAQLGLLLAGDGLLGVDVGTLFDLVASKINRECHRRPIGLVDGVRGNQNLAAG
jgi:hypothetical protein